MMQAFIACVLLLVSIAAGALSPHLSAHARFHHSRHGSPCSNAPPKTAATCSLNTSAFCAPGQLDSPCPAWEALQGQTACPCPGAGVVKRFTLVITRDIIPNALVPGNNRSVIRVNGTIPGPALVVNEDDWVEVTVINNISPRPDGFLEGTVVHYHGLFQHNTQYSDGVPSMTQCVLPPSQAVTYRFRAAQSGTYFYHGHYLEQFVDGLYGPLIINPTVPLPYVYDTDWTLMMQDFYNNEAHDLLNDYYLTTLSEGNEPIPDAITVNGVLSEQLVRSVGRNERMRLRFIASNAFSMFNVSIDGVCMHVIEVDGVAVQSSPPVAWFSLNVAQRVSVLVNWAEVPANVNAVYIRVTAMADMYPIDINGYVPPYELGNSSLYPPSLAVPGAKPLNTTFVAIVQFQAGTVPNYEGTLPCPTAVPPSDSNLLSLHPLTPSAAPAPTHQMYMEIDFITAPSGVQYASFNDISSMPSGLPALFDYLLPGKLPPFFDFSTPASNPYNASSLIPIYYDALGQYSIPYGAVVDIFINNTDDGEHPIHFHAHSFWCLGTSDYFPAPRPDGNYMRRDVISVPAAGWALIRIVADNPGVWAFHCHIDWHMAAGMMATLIEAPDVLRVSPTHIPEDFRFLCEGAYALQQNMSVHYPSMHDMMAAGHKRRSPGAGRHTQ
jgi:iron transport multicopper oxidase